MNASRPFASDKLPVGLANEPYLAELTSDGSVVGYRYAIVDGRLPEGLSLDAATGLITGRAVRGGEYRFTVGARDGSGAEVRQGYTLWVDESSGSASDATGQPLGKRQGRMSALSSSAEGTSTAPDLSALLTIVAGMGEGEWRRVNLNAYSSSWTPADLRPLLSKSNPTPDRIILAWSSFAWDTRRGNLFLYGGGHANYRGNDTYLWRGSTQLWERGSLPSEMVPTPLGYYNAIDGTDKAPASAHTYDNTIYLPIADRMLVLGGAADPNGGHYLVQPTPTTVRWTGPYLFDPSRAHPDRVGGTTGSHVQRVAPYPEIVGGNMWSNRESWLNASATSTPPTDVLSNGCTGYAEENGRDVVYVRSAYRLYRYEISDLATPSSDRWSQVGRFYWAGSGGQAACAYDPARKFFVSTHTSTTVPFLLWNLNTPGAANRDILITPTDPDNEFMGLISTGALQMRNCGFDFDPVRANYRLWCGGGRVWTLTPPATATGTGWVIQKARVPTDQVPTETLGTGIIGKWKYIPNLDVFMGLLDAVQGNIWIYKPVGWVNPNGTGNLPPSTSLTSPVDGTAFTVGSDIALTASAADGDGFVTKVEFFADSIKIGESVTAPFGMLWSGAPQGTHALTARATDDDGATKISFPVTITVNPVVVPNLPPSVGWISPEDGASASAGTAVTLEASAEDSDGSVSKVEFFAGDSKIGEALAAPWRCVWLTPPVGSHVLTALATDDDGASALSAPRTLMVSAAAGGAATVTLQRGTAVWAVADTYLSTWHKAINFGTATSVPDQYQSYAPLLRFAIFQSEGGPVPGGAKITSAVLSWYKSTSYDMSYALHRVQVEWSESAATWNERLSGIPWSTAGANGLGSDVSSTPDATASVGWDPGWLSFDVTAGVQQMSMTAGAGNFGWRLLPAAGYVSGLKRFHSSEFTGSISLRPKLVITYE